MFHSATLKLTAMYLGILLFVSLFFSYNWYDVATDELNRGLRQQQEFYQQRPREIDEERALELALHIEEQVREGKRIIALKVIYSNIIIVGLGAIGSYFLARRTLLPIEEAHNARIRFTADASHELRTPLAVMQSEIEVALRNKKLSSKETKELLASNLEELEKLSNLSSNLLKLARQDTADELEFQTLPVDEVLLAAKKRMKPLADAKKITITANVAAAQAMINSSSLEELVVILLENAIKYSPEKSIITLEGVLQKKQYKISVTDEGPGIKATDQVHIFERFFRADNSRSKVSVSGHGLGLSIAQNIAKAHGSKVSVSSKPGEGSTFSLYLGVIKS